jgi:outer membrane protein OmpA-like peptidoglycan-associated protein
MRHIAAFGGLACLALAQLSLPAAAVASAYAPAARVASLSPRAHALLLKHELDAAETQLRKRLEAMPAGNQIVMLRDDEQLTLRIPTRELFDDDSAQLRSHGAQDLPWAAVSELLRRHYRLAAQINVYTDSIGGQDANRGFTQQRALALLGALHAASVRPARVAGSGQGSSAELAGDDTPEGRDQNRRVEVVFGLPQPGFPQPGPPAS